MKKLSYEAKEKMVELAGACFWYWNGFFSFLDSCGVPQNLQSRYPRETHNKYQLMRCILSDLERTDQSEIISSIATGSYRLKGPIDKDNLDVAKASRLLREFRELLGNDPIENAVREQAHEQAKRAFTESVDRQKTQARKLGDLNSEFLALLTSSDVTPQQRGFRLEGLFFDLLHFSEIEHSRPYRTPGREQIDGHFRYEKFDYLVEVKWTEEQTKQPDLSIFDGKIRGKAQSTRGFFVSANGFDEAAIRKYSGDQPRIILMTGEDLALVLAGRVLLADALKAKVDSIVRMGEILFPLRRLAGA